MVSYVHVSIITIYKRERGACIVWLAALTNNPRQIIRDYTYYIRQSGKQERIQCDTFRGEKIIYVYIRVYACRKQHASSCLQKVGTEMKCSGDRLPVARVT